MEYPTDSIADGSREQIYTTHVTHQDLFFVNLESRSKILDDITLNLERKYSNVKDHEKEMHNIKLGSICAAKYNDDNSWYRAKVTGTAFRRNIF